MRKILLALCLATATAFAAPPLDILTFNIRYDNPADGENAWPKRSTMVCDWLKAESPDVIGIQEGLRHQLDDILKAIPEYAEYGVGRDDGKTAGEYAAILYKHKRFEPGEGGTFWLSDTPEIIASKSWGNSIPRICTWLYLKDRATGEGFTFYNLHLDHRSQPSRERSTALIQKRILAREHKDQPFFLVGDFNADEKNPAILALADGEPEMENSFRILHPESKEQGTFHGFKGGKTSSSKIDYIFASKASYTIKSAEIIHFERNGLYLSDHYPVRAKFQLK